MNDMEQAGAVKVISKRITANREHLMKFQENLEGMSLQAIISLMLLTYKSDSNLVERLLAMLKRKEYSKIPLYAPWIKLIDQGLSWLPTTSSVSWQYTTIEEENNFELISYCMSIKRNYTPEYERRSSPESLFFFVGCGKSVSMLNPHWRCEIVHQRSSRMQVMFRFPRHISDCGVSTLQLAVISPKQTTSTPNFERKFLTDGVRHLSWLFKDFDDYYLSQTLTPISRSQPNIAIEDMLSEWLLPPTKSPAHGVSISSPRGSGKTILSQKVFLWGLQHEVLVIYCDLSLFINRENTSVPLRGEIQKYLSKNYKFTYIRHVDSCMKLFVFDNVDECEKVHFGSGMFKEISKCVAESPGYHTSTHKVMCLTTNEFVQFSEPNFSGCINYRLDPLTRVQSNTLIKRSLSSSCSVAQQLVKSSKGKGSLLKMGIAVLNNKKLNKCKEPVDFSDEKGILRSYFQIIKNNPSQADALHQLVVPSVVKNPPSGVFKDSMKYNENIPLSELKLPLVDTASDKSCFYAVDRDLAAMVYANSCCRSTDTFKAITESESGENSKLTFVADVLHCYLDMIPDHSSEEFISSHSTIGTDTDIAGRTILHYSAARGYSNVIKFLLTYCQEAIDTTQIDKLGYTALAFSVLNNNIGCVELLSAVKSAVNAPGFSNSLSKGTNIAQMWAIHGNEEIFEILISTQIEKSNFFLTNELESASKLLAVAAVSGISKTMFEKLIIILTKSQTLSQIISADNKRTAAHAAVRGGHIHLLDYLAEIDISLVTLPDSEGRCLLHYAAIMGEFQIFDWYIKLLLKHKGEISLDSLSDNSGCTPLHYCCMLGYVAYEALLNCLSENATDPSIYINHLLDTSDKSGYLPIHYACSFSDCATVEAILQERPDQLGQASTVHRRTPLMLVAKHDNLKAYYMLMKMIKKFKKDDRKKLINAVDYRKQTALQIGVSTSCNYSWVSEDLVSISATDVFHRDDLQCDANLIAAAKGKSRFIKLVFGKFYFNISINDVFGMHVLHHVCASGHSDILKYLLESAEELLILPYTTNHIGQTPWHIIALSGSVESYSAMSGQKGITEVDNYERTPLHCALDSRNVGISLELLSHGVNQNAQDINGESCVLYLAAWCNCEVLQKMTQLTSPKTNFSLTDNRKRTAIHIASLCHNRTFVRRLLSLCDVSALSRDEAGLTPLHYAASVVDRSTCRQLLFKAPELVTARDNKGLTPMHYAMIGPHTNSLKFSWGRYSSFLPNHIYYTDS